MGSRTKKHAQIAWFVTGVLARPSVVSSVAHSAEVRKKEHSKSAIGVGDEGSIGCSADEDFRWLSLE